MVGEIIAKEFHSKRNIQELLRYNNPIHLGRCIVKLCLIRRISEYMCNYTRSGWGHRLGDKDGVCAIPKIMEKDVISAAIENALSVIVV